MSPPVEAFSPSELPIRLLSDNSGRKRKQKVDLAKCDLKELVQYDCTVERKHGPDRPGVILCDELVRVFRKCQGGLMVETTGMEKGQ